ncbi:MAG: Rrf2 family transcriptional regulator, partial [Oscillospiraceae bacterium]|nr:Rrf2 family transcriptional regulator [Oscillospiraceae bacterium]
QNYESGKFITLISISEKFSISKIYLEQVFSLLKKGGLVVSVKGSQGGYQLARTPESISAYDILFSIETTLFESAEETVPQSSPSIEKTIRQLVFDNLDENVKKTLSAVSLAELVSQTAKNSETQNIMYYI